MSDENHMKKIVKLTLLRIGIRCDLTGFDYLCYAVERAIAEPNSLKNLCKGLYAIIASEFETTPANVERCMRHAIDYTHSIKSFDPLNELFNAPLYSHDEKPTVGELIRLASEFYLLELYKDDPGFNI